MAANKDPYEILGVGRSASPDEIKQAYRRLAKKFHPDRNPNDKAAEQRFKEVQAAYEVLGDRERRAQYDQFGAGGPPPEYQTWQTGPGGPFAGDVQFDFGSLGDLTSIFEQFFQRGGAAGARRRGASRRPGGARGANIETEIELSFEEAARGTEREVVLTTDGLDAATERIRFRVPAGVADGQRIRVPGKGQAGLGGRGDLMIRVRTKPHAVFRREGLDVLLDMRISFPEAALGTQKEIPTLQGPTVVKIPPGTSGGTKLRLRGRGIHDARSDKTGDLYAVVRIQVPKELSPRSRELIEELQRELRRREAAAARVSS